MTRCGLGAADADRLFGGDGNDTLDGGADADVLTGGEGDDTVYYTNDWGIDEPILSGRDHGNPLRAAIEPRHRPAWPMRT